MTSITDGQRRTAEAIVNIFETGSATGDYGNVTVVPGDPGHLTYGKAQTTLPTGNLYLLIKAYVEAPGNGLGAALAPYLPRLQARDLSLDNDMALRQLLHRAGSDPVMHDVQDQFFDHVYWAPAQAAAAALNVQTALGCAVIYDSTVHGSFKLIRDRVLGALGPISDTVSEKDWISRYVATRHEWLATNTAVPLLQKTTYRMDEFRKLIDAGNWDLQLPIVVRGEHIDESVIGAGSSRISAHVTEQRTLSLMNPMLKGEDVKTLQLALINAGAQDLAADGVFGADTDACVRAFQQSRGVVVDGIVGPATLSALGID
jgi:chitosanase